MCVLVGILCILHDYTLLEKRSCPNIEKGVVSKCNLFEPLGGWNGINKVRSMSSIHDVAKKMQCYCMHIKDSCAHLRLEKGELTVLQIYRGTQTRIKGSLLTIYDAVNRNPAFTNSPPIEFVIEISDGERGCDGLPVFMMTTRNNDCITVPDFTFGSWPESSCPPGDERHSWKSLHNKIGPADNSTTVNGLVWSGAITGNIRPKFIKEIYPKLLNGNQLVNIQITEWQQTSTALGETKAKNCMTLAEACKYKYQIYLPGYTYSSNLKYKLMCGSVVMAIFNEWREWWYQALDEKEVVVKIDNMDIDNIVKVANGGLTTHQEKTLMDNSMKLVQTVLSPDSVACYWENILSSIAWEVPQRSNVGVPVADVLMMDIAQMHFSVIDESQCP
jgi:hypothetical protein